MKKLLLLHFFLISFITMNAQVSKTERDIAFDLVSRNAKDIGLSKDDLGNFMVSGTYQNDLGGIRMIYLQQTFKGLPVFNQMLVLAFKNGKLVSNTGVFISGMDKRTNAQSATPVISPADAVRAAIREAKIDMPASIVPVDLLQNGRKVDFGTLNIASEHITAELMWAPTEGKDATVKLAWQIQLVPLANSDYWNIRVDAVTNLILNKNNLTVNDLWEKSPSKKSNSIPQALVAKTGILQPEISQNQNNSPSLATTANYLVIPYPAESPIHTGGTAALRTNPWTLAGGNAVSLGWHNNGTTDFTTSRGNNVHAHEDRAASNSNTGIMATSSTTPDPLNFNFPPNYTLAPTTAAFQQFAITNLFYWNNILHDISYKYGFTEAAGNFQASNQGRGGAGNDYVQADAQDNSGSNNANFSTPVDGSSGRMQMYLFNSVTPNLDGDLDNGVIVHEYMHGISNRLTGGPANSSCLSNAEQGGEGWSDYNALMLTTDWSTALVTDGYNKPRPIGNYVINAAAASLPGIRNYAYSTNISVNPLTYANMGVSPIGTEVHNIGEIWCAALWEMTWEMIQLDGINPNLFDPTATGGNSAAYRLVMEGMKLQPCSPGFIDARNAILKADTLYFAAKYSCAIWKAFSKRGMGKNASQGSSASATDQVADFTNLGNNLMNVTQNVIQQQEGLNIIYTNHVTAGTCSALTNYTLRDTLPANVTYVSGGTYSAATRVVSFPVNLAAGASQNYSFTVQVNAGSYFPPQTLIDEPVAGAVIPATWTISSTTATNWAVSSAQSHSVSNSLFSLNLPSASDQKIQTTNNITLPASPSPLTFWGYINAEPAYDGGVVEISTNGGTTWTDLGADMSSGGYNGTLNSSGTNPIRGRVAFTGNSGGFIKTTINMASYAGQNVKFRFRFGSDASVAATGWYIDDIQLNSIAVVNMRSGLFNSSDIRIIISDTITTILPGVTCTTGSISSQPANASGCSGTDATFTVNATGTALTYQWQVSTNGGGSFTDVSLANSSSLTLTGITNAMNNNQYRCVINGTCTVLLVSNVAILSVNARPVIPVGTAAAGCGPGTVSISAAPGAGETIDWYSANTGGIALQTGSVSFLTPVINVSTTYFAEARNTTSTCISATRTPVLATINSLPVLPTGTGASRCGPGILSISASAGTNETIDWYAAATGGPALLSSSLSYTTSSISSSVTYYAESRNTGTGCVSVSRTPVLAKVNLLPLPPVGTGSSNCGATAFTISAAAGTNETIDWYETPSGGSALQSSSIIYITPLLSSSVTYYAESRNLITGCVSATRTPVEATVINTTSSITSISICPNQLPYVWNGISFNSGGSHTVTLTNAAGCDSLAKLLLDITPSFILYNVTGGGSYNIGGAGVAIGLSSSQPGVIYQLIIGGTTNAGLPVTGTGSAISFGNQTAAGSYTVIANPAVVCSQLMTGNAIVTITNNPPIQYSLTGGGTYCSGSAGLAIGLTGSELGVNYQLKRNNGTVNVGAPVAGTGMPISFGIQTAADTYSVQASNTVSLSTQNMLNTVMIRIALLKAPSTPGVITGPSDACPLMGAGPVTYTIRQVANATSYVWTVPAGATIIGNNTDTMVVVQYDFSFVSGSLTVTSINSCFGNAASSARSLTIARRVPSAPGAITSSAPNPCAIVGTGSTATFTIRPVTYATSYQWVLSTGITLISGLGDTGIVVKFDNGFSTGTVKVASVNNCWISVQRSLTVKATKPTTPLAITGPTNVCTFIGQPAAANYSIALVSGASYYTWTTPANTTIVSGQGTNSIMVSFTGTFASGSISVLSNSNCGSSTARSLTVTKTVAKPGIISPSAPPCPSTTVTYIIAGVPFASSYLWTVPTNAVYVSGQGTTSFVVTYNANFISGTVSVKAINACSTSTASSLVVAATECVLPKPAFSSGNQLSSDLIKNEAIVYPNPNQGVFSFSLSHIKSNVVKIYLLDMYGHLVKQQQLIVNKSGMVDERISAAGISAGIYELRYADGNIIKSIKVVIAK